MLQIVRRKPRVFGNAGEHFRADFVAVVKSEDKNAVTRNASAFYENRIDV